MSAPILSPVALCYAEREFWKRHSESLRRRQATAHDSEHLALLLRAEAFAMRRWAQACEEYATLKFNQS